MSKLKSFLGKVKDVIPEVAGAGLKLATGNVGGAIAEIGEVLRSKADKDEKAAILLKEYDKYLKEFELEAMELEIQDRANARELYIKDASLQKYFALTFLVTYVALTAVTLVGTYYVSLDKIEIPAYLLSFVSAIFGGITMKIGTITDFLFGGSAKKEVQ
jgi:Na+/glutamate symporter